MDRAAKLYVHMPIDAVDTVVYDPEGAYDPEQFDRYPTYVAARDAALSSVELLLDEGDYDGDDHREELVRMLSLLETADTFDDLNAKPDYHWFLGRITAVRPHAA